MNLFPFAWTGEEELCQLLYTPTGASWYGSTPLNPIHSSVETEAVYTGNVVQVPNWIAELTPNCNRTLSRSRDRMYGTHSRNIRQPKKAVCIALHGKPISELRDVTCHMGSHSVTCHPTQVNTPRLNPSQSRRYSIYLPRKDGRLSWLT